MDDTREIAKTKMNLKPTQVLAVGFLALILLGTLLLRLPASNVGGISASWVDCLFTSTSAVCVTGLNVVPTIHQWSTFGQVVIMLLIQAGGLGFMTLISCVFLILGKKITLRERMIIQESLNQNNLRGLVRLVRGVALATFLFEAVGAVILTFRFLKDYPLDRSIFMGIFHSISAFCNAGFDIVGNASLAPYISDLPLNITMCTLIVVGGLGFIVWSDLFHMLQKVRKGNHSFSVALRQMTLHTKVVLTMTAGLIIAGAALFFAFECLNPATFGVLPLGDKISASFFQSVTCRTAGFSEINQNSMTYASQLLSMILMFVGGSPSSTAGGIKTVTMAVLLITLISVSQGRRTTHIYRKDIPLFVLQKAITIFLVALGVICASTMLLTFTEAGSPFRHEFLDLLFENVSAFTTTGLSTGITPALSAAGKLIISLEMYIGRIGPIAIASALSRRQRAFSEVVEYPEESVMVG
ncbi:MAG: potassium transporter TrkG [Clostridia bacterium]|nr:potassium transporter TrkG [Clostridia bacterium]